MSEETVLIRTMEAAPQGDSSPLSLPLTCEISSATLVCILGQRFKILNSYMEMLAGIKEPSAGSIDYLDTLINNDKAGDSPDIAYLYHDTALLSVLNGIANVKIPALYHQLASAKELDDEVDALLGEFEYGADHRQLPAFMDALQKRHLLIVRSILLKPRILFIENPFKDLDREQVRLLGNYIAGLVKNKNITVVTSNVNLDFVQRYADQIIYIASPTILVFKQWEVFSKSIKGHST